MVTSAITSRASFDTLAAGPAASVGSSGQVDYFTNFLSQLAAGAAQQMDSSVRLAALPLPAPAPTLAPPPSSPPETTSQSSSSSPPPSSSSSGSSASSSSASSSSSPSSSSSDAGDADQTDTPAANTDQRQTQDDTKSPANTSAVNGQSGGPGRRQTRATTAARAGTTSKSDQTGSTDPSGSVDPTTGQATEADGKGKGSAKRDVTGKDAGAGPDPKAAQGDPNAQAVSPGLMAVMVQANPLVGTGGSVKTGPGLPGGATAGSSAKGRDGSLGAATTDGGKAGIGPATVQSKAGKGQGTTAAGSQAGLAGGVVLAAAGGPDVSAAADPGADAGGLGAGLPFGGDPDGAGTAAKNLAASLNGLPSAVAAGQTAAALAAARAAAELAQPVGAAQAALSTSSTGSQGDDDPGLSGDGGSNRARSGVAGQDGNTPALAGINGPQAADGQDFASQLTAVRGGRSGQPAGATEQVTVQIQRSVKDGDGSISMQLRPEELGRIDIKLDIGKDGMVNATITAERPQTLELLQRDSHTLERALQDAGLQTNSDSLNFGLRGDGGQGYSQQQQQQQYQQQYQGNAGGNGTGGGQRRGLGGVGTTGDDTTATAMMVLRRYQTAPGRVDVRI